MIVESSAASNQRIFAIVLSIAPQMGAKPVSGVSLRVTNSPNHRLPMHSALQTVDSGLADFAGSGD